MYIDVFLLQLSELKDELTLLKDQLAEKERALAAARTAAHSTNMDSQEVCVCVCVCVCGGMNVIRVVVNEWGEGRDECGIGGCEEYM